MKKMFYNLGVRTLPVELIKMCSVIGIDQDLALLP